jgi:hypothetical protein
MMHTAGLDQRREAMKEMSSREILDAIRKGVEESARRAAEDERKHVAEPPLREPPARSIGEMTAREILEAIDKGLEETSLRFAKDHGEHQNRLPKNTKYPYRGD